MAFLSGLLGDKGAESMVDKAVDSLASTAKEKAKEFLGGDSGKKEEDKNQGGGLLAGILPSGSKEEEKPSSGGTGDFTDALGDVAAEMGGGESQNKDGLMDQFLSIGKSVLKE
ncbi:hypothetical protein JZ751_011186 [Albula glossodonta]|uniref:Uncharacterized protein n=1 Tax=Albula glossodonta TaxID=121402 RepID=A0A8T2NYB5_9TELE|nr:hypothetical protein JZ751_011186 [Albula glossodonta]